MAPKKSKKPKAVLPKRGGMSAESININVNGVACLNMAAIWKSQFPAFVPWKSIESLGAHFRKNGITADFYQPGSHNGRIALYTMNTVRKLVAKTEAAQKKFRERHAAKKKEGTVSEPVSYAFDALQAVRLLRTELNADRAMLRAIREDVEDIRNRFLGEMEANASIREMLNRIADAFGVEVEKEKATPPTEGEKPVDPAQPAA